MVEVFNIDLRTFKTYMQLVKFQNCSWCLQDLQLHVQSVPITTNVLSSNPVHGVVYSIEHYVKKFVSDLRQVGGFLRVLRHDIIEILLKVALNTCSWCLQLLNPHLYGFVEFAR
jgi:hypothetical protein